MNEINLLQKYPKAKRDLFKRAEEKTEQDREIARKFDKDFFDGDRRHGYGGYNYHPKFWTDVVKDFQSYYNLNNYSRILDVGCGKGFMLYDFKKLNQSFDVYGIDISSYAIENSIPEIKSNLKLGNAKQLPYQDNFFDLVVSINTIHNLDVFECEMSIKEIERVSKKNKYLIVDAYSNNIEKDRIYRWNLTAKTILSTEDWLLLFKKASYSGDYYWFKP